MQLYKKFGVVALCVLALSACSSGNSTSPTSGSSSSSSSSGGGSSSSSSSSGGSARTEFDVKVRVENAQDQSPVSNAEVVLLDGSGNKIFPNISHSTDANGDVRVTLSASYDEVVLKAMSSNFVTTTARVEVPENAAAVSRTLSMLSVGGTVNAPFSPTTVFPSGDGAEVTLGSATFVDEEGNVQTPDKIDYTVLNPLANPSAFPGDANITMQDGSPGIMVSSGMVDLVFYDSNGNRLNLQSPSSVLLRMPLYSTLDPISGNPLVPGDTVKFWSMDEDTGQWKEETNALVVVCGSPSGLCAEGNVTHFSWWNTDFAVSADSKDTLVVDAETNAAFDESLIDSIVLQATFTEVVTGSSYYSTAAVRTTNINVDDFIRIGNGFDIEFVLQVNFADGSTSAKRYNYSWSEIQTLNEFRFVIGRDDEYQDIKLSVYDTSYDLYQTYATYIGRDTIGINIADVVMTVEGVTNGNSTVGTLQCFNHDYEDYCMYTKGTQSGDITIRAASPTDSTVYDEVVITVDNNTPQLALEGTMSEYTYSTEGHSWYQTVWYLSPYTLNAMSNVDVATWSYDLWGASYQFVVEPGLPLDASGYTVSIVCENATGGACASGEEFATVLTMTAADFPTVYNPDNTYYLQASDPADASVSTRMRIIYQDFTSDTL